jgi:dTDP-4-amino-4,6-dideoxygalactose transaminase
MPESHFGRSNRWLTCVTIDPAKISATPDEIRIALEKENIESRPLWKPMHLQPVFKNSPAYTNGVSEKLFSSGLCLPSGIGMSEEEQLRVISCIKEKLVR